MSQQEQQRTLTDADFDRYGKMWRESGSQQATTERADTTTTAPRRDQEFGEKLTQASDRETAQRQQTKNFSENRGTNNPPRPKGTGQPPPQQQQKAFSAFVDKNFLKSKPNGAAQGKSSKDNAALLKAMGATSMKTEVVYAGIITWLAIIAFICLLGWFSAMGTRLVVQDNMNQHCVTTVFKGVKSSSCPSLNTAVFDVGLLQWFDWAKVIFLVQALVSVIVFRLQPHFDDQDDFSFAGFAQILLEWLRERPGHALFCLLLVCFDAGTTFRNLKETVTGWHLVFLKFDLILGPGLPFYNWLLIGLAVSISAFSFMALVYAINNLREDFSYL